MGYSNQSEYACLKIEIPEERCKVADMSLSSVAFFNYMMGKKNKEYIDYHGIIKQYDESAVSIRDYRLGMFHAPEVLIQGSVDPHHLSLDVEKETTTEYAHKDYDQRIRQMLAVGTVTKEEYAQKIAELIQQRKLRLVGMHDDKNGMYHAYQYEETNELISLPLEYLST